MSTVMHRYAQAVMPTYGPPSRVLVRGEGCWVWDEDGRRYLDLLAGIAVNTLGHAHPALVAAVSRQLATLGHVSNLFTTPVQVALAERLLALLDAPAGSRVFFANSGAEANEAAFKITRRTGRSRVVAAVGGFHGRTMGALALTGKPAAREGFEPLPGGVVHVPYGDPDALAAAVDTTCAAVVLEPIQGEAGVVPAPPGYLALARSLADSAGALLVLDEVQSGVGRTGAWFAHEADGVRPDVVTLAKGLAGGLPIGACVALGATGELLGPGSHGSTFGGNPVSAAAALAVLDTIELDGLRDNALARGRQLSQGLAGHPGVRSVRGRGLLLGVVLDGVPASAVAGAALPAGFVVNAVAPDTVRLAPPLVLDAAQAQSFVDAWPQILDAATEVTP
jgi:acetylornithine aminotransferase